MAAVDPLLAQWLQSEGLWAVTEAAGIKARWGKTALVGERMTGLAAKADAEFEGDHVLAFRGGPLVEDVAELPGSFVHSIGTVITVEIGELGYDAGIDVFVLAAEDDRAARISRVTFLRRL